MLIKQWPKTVGNSSFNNPTEVSKFYVYEISISLCLGEIFFIFGGERVKEEKLQMKAQLVDEIKGKIESAQSIVLVNYRGLNVAEVTELRANFREVGVDYKVYKNTMMVK